MIWLTWRQSRAQAAAVAAPVVVLAVVLAVTGPHLAHLYAQDPTTVFDRLTSTDRTMYYAAAAVSVVAPAIIGLFWGAPMVARELEAGTHRMVWTQTVTRTRWLATKLALTALAALGAVGVLSLAVSWWSGPLDGALSTTRGNLPTRLTPVVFSARGVVPLGYTLFALVLGVAAGLVLRRTLAAMALTLAVLVAVQVAVPLWVRPHLAPPVRETLSLTDQNVVGVRLTGDDTVTLEVAAGGPGTWVLTDRTVDASGSPTALPSWLAGCLPPSAGPRPVGTAGTAGDSRQTFAQCLDRLDADGYRQELVYQPDSNFWRLQATETALYVAVSGLLAGFCFWWTRRRLC